MTEKIDIQQLYEGDSQLFDRLYRQHAQTIYRLGWSMLREEQAAEDVVQETFLRAYKARKRFNPTKASFGTWLYQIALNYCRSQLRRKPLLPFPWFNQLGESSLEPAATINLERWLIHDEYQQALWQAVEKLSPRLKEVITLHYYLELPAVEIALMLDCPEGTIYSRLHNARRQLAKFLRQQGFTATEIIEVNRVSSSPN